MSILAYSLCVRSGQSGSSDLKITDNRGSQRNDAASARIEEILSRKIKNVLIHGRSHGIGEMIARANDTGALATRSRSERSGSLRNVNKTELPAELEAAWISFHLAQFRRSSMKATRDNVIVNRRSVSAYCVQEEKKRARRHVQPGRLGQGLW